ncbi:hypothetical protein PPSIR1_21534 [Plesiocystis pacifica SIR-1]|uniref:DNA alkylation repair enzyme n=1 Tax=Plesiocystis pacifica SIR-1 TaxID=391625 RepID=A6FXF4_9BACT|nr:hypothetical protein [Plesiocystis pacifica]EDM81542.1 hypothetical protein PPSIR1_21534 [Plesiocystis pacifica SIR-1]
MTEPKPAPFKHRVSSATIRALAEHLRAEDPSFPAERFVRRARRGLGALELKARIQHIAEALAATLPEGFPEASARIRGANARRGVPGTGDLEGTMFTFWPLCTYVEGWGLEHPELALDTMHGLTALASCEFAIRPYIEAEPERVWARLERWVSDPNVHVRRLVSEGTRPRLPWGRRLRALQADPGPSLALLDQLRGDPELYVRRSVANHLNDISKDHPQLAVEVATRWQAEDDSDALAWVVRHALRGLVKAGNPGALALQGFGPPKVRLAHFRVGPERLQFGGSLSLSVELRPRASQDLLIDYAIHHRKADGSTRAKVFKWTRRRVEKGEVLRLDKQHGIRPISTRRYHDGPHRAELLINGKSLAMADFELVGAS